MENLVFLSSLKSAVSGLFWKANSLFFAREIQVWKSEDSNFTIGFCFCAWGFFVISAYVLISSCLIWMASWFVSSKQEPHGGECNHILVW